MIASEVKDNIKNPENREYASKVDGAKGNRKEWRNKQEHKQDSKQENT